MEEICLLVYLLVSAALASVSAWRTREPDVIEITIMAMFWPAILCLFICVSPAWLTRRIKNKLKHGVWFT